MPSASSGEIGLKRLPEPGAVGVEGLEAGELDHPSDLRRDGHRKGGDRDQGRARGPPGKRQGRHRGVAPRSERELPKRPEPAAPTGHSNPAKL